MEMRKDAAIEIENQNQKGTYTIIIWMDVKRREERQWWIDENEKECCSFKFNLKNQNVPQRRIAVAGI